MIAIAIFFDQPNISSNLTASAFQAPSQDIGVVLDVSSHISDVEIVN